MGPFGSYPSETLSAFLIALLPLALLLAPLSGAWLLPCTAASLAWLAVDERSGGFAWHKLAPGWIWLPLLAWMGLSAFWASDHASAAGLAARLSLLTFAGVILPVAWRQLPLAVADRLLVIFAYSAAISGTGVIADDAFGYPVASLFHGHDRTTPIADVYSRGAVFLAMICLPLGLAQYRSGRKRLGVFAFLSAVSVILMGVQVSAKAALVAAILAALLVHIRLWFRWVLLGGLVAGALAAPILLPHQPTRSEQCWLVVHKPSALHRMLIWQWVDGRIEEHPLLGWGLDASRRMPGGHDRVVVHGCDDPPGSPPRLDNEILPLHPHDAALQIWLELGAAGAAFAAFGLAGSVARAYHRMGRAGSAAVAAAMMAASLAAALSFGIWQEWWFATLWLGAWITVASAEVTLQR